MEIKKILIVFKTHLDMGFTDFAANVKKRYFEEFIPNAVKVSLELEKLGGEVRFKWTTGSWLIYEYLKNADDKNRDGLIKAIGNGNICWHGLPFTTHTELMSKELFEYGLSLSQRLDRQFGKKTIAAKMTDVPGHTKAIIPLLKKAGIEMLHIGVNPASAVPEVPQIFRWQADSGETVNVIYSGDYGEFTPLGDTGTALYFAHTGDNLGSQSAEDVENIFAELRDKFPNAELIASDLNAAAEIVREFEDTLPIVTDEIGDSWIHGTGTDPKKVSQFRALQRLFSELPDGDDKEILGAGLLIIPEHTWGLDEKTHLYDNAHYSRAEFEAHRNEPNYKKMEASWAEQRRYLYDAVKKLSDGTRKKAELLLKEAEREYVDTSDYETVAPHSVIKNCNYEISFNEKGEIEHLVLNGRKIAGKDNVLCSFMYEKFSYENYLVFHRNYNRSDVDWAWQDFTKPNMGEASSEYCCYCPEAEIYYDGDRFIIEYSFCDEARTLFGTPEKAQMIIEFDKTEILFDLAWFNKPANRIAEAFWLGFNPLADGRKISKLSSFIDPEHVVSRGNRNLHATDRGVYWNDMSIEPVDSALVAPQKTCVLDYPNEIPAEKDGVYFGLYNNLWGTNFPMWYGENSRFRFKLILT